MKITEIEAIPLVEPEPAGWDGLWVTMPLDALNEPFERVPFDLSSQRGRVTNVVVRVRTDDGLEGVGTVGVGTLASVPFIERELAPLLVGRRPFDSEANWERMFRATINAGRKGFALEAISAIDVALWDVMGKALGVPVCDLLGGRTHRRIRAYASQAYATTDLDSLAAEARGHVAQGFTALKMRFGYGPTDGRPGMRANHELVGTVRDAIGPDVELMADAYMGWDARYAVPMIKALEEFDLAWVEEPLVPDDIEGYVRLRSRVDTPIAAGEHEFTRWGFRELVARGAVDIVQPDVNRMGGITEARKVWALASAHNLPVVPHSQQAHNAHLIAAHLNSPLIECFPHGSLRSGYMLFTELLHGEPEAVDGYVELSDRPGLGVTLDEDVLERYRHRPGADEG